MEKKIFKTNPLGGGLYLPPAVKTTIVRSVTLCQSKEKFGGTGDISIDIDDIEDGF